jgi:hypothetical protein
MDLQPWNTPFTSTRAPSVYLIAESKGDSTVSLVVAPKGADQYPKYVVQFTAVYAFGVAEEAGAESLAACLVGQAGDWQGCTYIWRDSPHAREYQRFVPDMPFRSGRGPVKHYVVLGGDNVVAVIAAEPPVVHYIDAPQVLHLKYEV